MSNKTKVQHDKTELQNSTKPHQNKQHKKKQNRTKVGCVQHT